jgi:hypothetical protein
MGLPRISCGLDDKQTGFGVRVDVDGRKSYFWYKKVKGIPRFRALGEFPVVAVKQARDSAAHWTGVAAQWKQSGYAGPDPFEKQCTTSGGVPTFAELFEVYVAHHLRKTGNRPERAEYVWGFEHMTVVNVGNSICGRGTLGSPRTTGGRGSYRHSFSTITTSRPNRTESFTRWPTRWPNE